MRNSTVLAFVAIAVAAGAPFARAADVDAYLAPLPAPQVDQTKAAPYKALLETHVRQFLGSQPYAPLRYLTGKIGVMQVFAQSNDAFIAMARAYPYVPPDVQASIKAYLKGELSAHPPWDATRCFYDPKAGRRREYYTATTGPAGRAPALEIGALYGVWLFVQNAGAWDLVQPYWNQMKTTLSGSVMKGFRIDAISGHWAMNPVVSGLAGYMRMADHFGDAAASAAARTKLGAALDQLAAYWADRPTFPKEKYFAGVGTGTGDVLVLLGSQTTMPEGGACLVCLAHMTGETARFLRAEPARTQVNRVLTAMDNAAPTWYVSWAERYIHRGGENAMDEPGESPGILLARSILHGQTFDQLKVTADIPLCDGDFFYMQKLVTIIESTGGPAETRPHEAR